MSYADERISELERGLLSATRLAWLLVKASGGSVRIPQRVVESLNPTTASLSAFHDLETGDFVYEALSSDGDRR